MQPLGFDFAAPSHPSRWLGWLLLGCGLALLSHTARDYFALRSEVESLQARGAQHGAVPRLAAARLPAANADEIAAARTVVRRFAVPWPALFEAIESVKIDGVSLLSVEPDVASGQLLITADGKDYLAVLSYVAGLSGHPAFTEVHLARHEIRDSLPRRPVSFSVRARWRAT